MQVQFYGEGHPDQVVAEARWDGRRAVIEAPDDESRAALERVFRLTPVVVSDPSLRPMGATGDSSIQPGSLEWFRSAAVERAKEVGLRARLVPEAGGKGGWDPASAYRTFRRSVEVMLTPPDVGS